MLTKELSELRELTEMSLKTRTREMSQLGDKGGAWKADRGRASSTRAT